MEIQADIETPEEIARKEEIVRLTKELDLYRRKYWKEKKVKAEYEGRVQRIGKQAPLEVAKLLVEKETAAWAEAIKKIIKTSPANPKTLTHLARHSLSTEVGGYREKIKGEKASAEEIGDEVTRRALVLISRAMKADTENWPDYLEESLEGHFKRAAKKGLPAAEVKVEASKAVDSEAILWKAQLLDFIGADELHFMVSRKKRDERNPHELHSWAQLWVDRYLSVEKQLYDQDVELEVITIIEKEPEAGEEENEHENENENENENVEKENQNEEAAVEDSAQSNNAVEEPQQEETEVAKEPEENQESNPTEESVGEEKPEKETAKEEEPTEPVEVTPQAEADVEAEDSSAAATTTAAAPTETSSESEPVYHASEAGSAVEAGGEPAAPVAATESQPESEQTSNAETKASKEQDVETAVPEKCESESVKEAQPVVAEDAAAVESDTSKENTKEKENVSADSQPAEDSEDASRRKSFSIVVTTAEGAEETYDDEGLDEDQLQPSEEDERANNDAAAEANGESQKMANSTDDGAVEKAEEASPLSERYPEPDTYDVEEKVISVKVLIEERRKRDADKRAQAQAQAQAEAEAEAASCVEDSPAVDVAVDEDKKPESNSVEKTDVEKTAEEEAEEAKEKEKEMLEQLAAWFEGVKVFLGPHFSEVPNGFVSQMHDDLKVCFCVGTFEAWC